MKVIARILSLLALLLSGLIWTGSYRAAFEPYSAAAAAAAFFITLVSPAAAVSLLLATLPLYGNKPATPQSWYLILCSAAVICGYELRKFADGRRRIPAAPANLLEDALQLYVLVSILSLAAVPLGIEAGQLLQALDSAANWRQQVSTIAFWLVGLFHLPEDQPVYPLAAVVKTLLAWRLGAICIELIRRARSENPANPFRLPLIYCQAVLAGTILAVSAGLVHYYFPIGLQYLRPLDPTANAGGVEFRLQSFFAHSGWFAEYLTLSIPFVMVVLPSRRSFALRVGIIIAILLAGEVALILSYQRGGWISYPLTLLAIWAAIYSFRAGERSGQERINFSSVLRSSLFKIAVSVPLTVAISLSLVWAVRQYGPLGSGSVDDYFSRFKDISRTSDRTDFMRAGAKIASLHPFMGAGSESFAIEFDREFDRPGGRFYQQIKLPLHGSAHNVFFQTAAGKGAAGLLLLLLTVILIGRAGLLALKDPELPREQSVIGLISICFAAAFLIYGNVQEIFYVSALELLFFCSAGIAAAALPCDQTRRLRLPAAVALFFAGHLLWEYLVPGETGRRLAAAPFGCFAAEQAADGRSYRWCEAQARQQLPVIIKDGQPQLQFELRFPLSVHPENIVIVRLDGRTVFSKAVSIGQSEIVTVDLPAQTRAGDSKTVEIISSSLVIPARDLPGSRDMRLLSFQLL